MPDNTIATAVFTHPALTDYARLLHEHGFTIRVHTGTTPQNFFVYSRPGSEDTELFGIASLDRLHRLEQTLGADCPIEHLMPIAPSTAHGSSMWVPGARRGADLDTAHAVTRETNTNDIVGTHRNSMTADRLTRYQIRQEF